MLDTVALPAALLHVRPYQRVPSRVDGKDTKKRRCDKAQEPRPAASRAGQFSLLPQQQLPGPLEYRQVPGILTDDLFVLHLRTQEPVSLVIAGVPQRAQASGCVEELPQLVRLEGMAVA